MNMKREFTALIKQDNGWWIGWIEEIPGVNSQGKTRQEQKTYLEARGVPVRCHFPLPFERSSACDHLSNAAL